MSGQWSMLNILDTLLGKVLCQYRVHAMQEFRKPVYKKDLRAFLESIGYYRKFINNFVKHSLLTPATSSKASGKVHWTPGMEEAFSQLKVCLCDHVDLMYHYLKTS